MKTLSKNKKLALITCAVMIISILAVSIGLIVNAVEKSRTVVADSDNGQLLSGKVYDMPKQLTLTDNMADGKTAVEGVNLRVILKPSFVSNAKINFSIKWKDSAVEDDVNTFITLTTLNDTQCNLKIAQRFNNQIELVATAELDKSITKTCAVDCYSYLESMNTTFELHQKESIKGTGNIKANSTDKIYDGGVVSNASLGYTFSTGSMMFNYYNDIYISVEGDYSFGIGTKLIYNKLVSDFSFLFTKSVTSDSTAVDENLKIDFAKFVDITTKTGTFEIVSEKLNLNYFYDNNFFANWYVNAIAAGLTLPAYDASKDFYRNNVDNFMQDMVISYKLTMAGNVRNSDVYGGLFFKDANYLYDMSFDDSVVIE